MILRTKAYFAARFLMNRFRIHLASFVIVFVFALIKTDGRLEHEKHIVARTFDLADGASNTVRVRKGFVDGVAQFLHQLLESVVQNIPFPGQF